MMELRRMVMAQMASGAEVIKGSFTVPDSESRYTLDFGKTLSKYMFFFEMTDASKSTLLGTGITGTRAFFVEGLFPNRAVNDVEIGDTLVYRVVPSTGVLSPNYNSSIVKERSSTSMILAIGGTSSTNLFYWGYSYNYYIVEIK